jgi:hypothetical protein
MVVSEEMESYRAPLQGREGGPGDYRVHLAAVGRETAQEAQCMGLTGAGSIEVNIGKVENFH